MPRYDLYRSVHKFIRREMFQFGEKLGRTDFRNKEAVAGIQKSFDELAFDLAMHAQKEEKWFTPLFTSKGSAVCQLTKKEHSDQPGVLIALQDLFKTAIEAEDVEAQIVQGNHIRSEYDKFLAHNLQHFYEEENVLMPELWRLYDDEALRQVTIDSYKALPPHVLLDSASFFPVLDPTEKHTYLEDLQKACPKEVFNEIWQRATSAGCFTADEASDFCSEFGLPLTRSAADDAPGVVGLVQELADSVNE
jgi:iron-sulfur cluster repair protein YtfE (RIC family)